MRPVTELPVFTVLPPEPAPTPPPPVVSSRPRVPARWWVAAAVGVYTAQVVVIVVWAVTQ